MPLTSINHEETKNAVHICYVSGMPHCYILVCKALKGVALTHMNLEVSDVILFANPMQ